MSTSSQPKLHNGVYVDEWNVMEKVTLATYVGMCGEDKWARISELMKKKLTRWYTPDDWYTPATCSVQWDLLVRELYDANDKSAALPLTQIHDKLRAIVKRTIPPKEERLGRTEELERKIKQLQYGGVDKETRKKYYREAKEMERQMKQKCQDKLEFLKKRKILKYEYEAYGEPILPLNFYHTYVEQQRKNVDENYYDNERRLRIIDIEEEPITINDEENNRKTDHPFTIDEQARIKVEEGDHVDGEAIDEKIDDNNLTINRQIIIEDDHRMICLEDVNQIKPELVDNETTENNNDNNNSPVEETVPKKKKNAVEDETLETNDVDQFDAVKTAEQEAAIIELNNMSIESSTKDENQDDEMYKLVEYDESDNESVVGSTTTTTAEENIIEEVTDYKDDNNKAFTTEEDIDDKDGNFDQQSIVSNELELIEVVNEESPSINEIIDTNNDDDDDDDVISSKELEEEFNAARESKDDEPQPDTDEDDETDLSELVTISDEIERRLLLEDNDGGEDVKNPTIEDDNRKESLLNLTNDAEHNIVVEEEEEVVSVCSDDSVVEITFDYEESVNSLSKSSDDDAANELTDLVVAMPKEEESSQVADDNDTLPTADYSSSDNIISYDVEEIASADVEDVPPSSDDITTSNHADDNSSLSNKNMDDVIIAPEQQQSVPVDINDDDDDESEQQMINNLKDDEIVIRKDVDISPDNDQDAATIISEDVKDNNIEVENTQPDNEFVKKICSYPSGKEEDSLPRQDLNIAAGNEEESKFDFNASVSSDNTDEHLNSDIINVCSEEIAKNIIPEVDEKIIPEVDEKTAPPVELPISPQEENTNVLENTASAEDEDNNRNDAPILYREDLLPSENPSNTSHGIPTLCAIDDIATNDNRPLADTAIDSVAEDIPEATVVVQLTVAEEETTAADKKDVNDKLPIDNENNNLSPSNEPVVEVLDSEKKTKGNRGGKRRGKYKKNKRNEKNTTLVVADSTDDRDNIDNDSIGRASSVKPIVAENKLEQSTVNEVESDPSSLPVVEKPVDRKRPLTTTEKSDVDVPSKRIRLNEPNDIGLSDSHQTMADNSQAADISATPNVSTIADISASTEISATPNVSTIADISVTPNIYTTANISTTADISSSSTPSISATTTTDIFATPDTSATVDTPAVAASNIDTSLSKRRGPRKKSISSTPSGQQSVDQKMISLIYAALHDCKYVDTFRLQLTDKIVPGYSKLIYSPMNLITLKKKIDSGELCSMAECQKDILLMLSNAKMYNPSYTQVYVMTRETETVVLRQMKIAVETTGRGVLHRLEPTSPPRRSSSATSSSSSSAKTLTTPSQQQLLQSTTKRQLGLRRSSIAAAGNVTKRNKNNNKKRDNRQWSDYKRRFVLRHPKLRNGLAKEKIGGRIKSGHQRRPLQRKKHPKGGINKSTGKSQQRRCNDHRNDRNVRGNRPVNNKSVVKKYPAANVSRKRNLRSATGSG